MPKLATSSIRVKSIITVEQYQYYRFYTIQFLSIQYQYFVIVLITSTRVLARISKMPVQNSNFQISARPDLDTNQFPILIPSTTDCLVYQKGQYTLQLCLRRWFLRKIFGYYTPNVNIEKSS